MMNQFLRLAHDRKGAAAAEMALSLPLLLVLLFGGFETGNFFLSEHVVQKAVRDASRFAARLPMSAYPSCTSTPAAPESNAEQQIKRVARTGNPSGDYNGDGTANQEDSRLNGWTDGDVLVRVRCPGSGSYSSSGIYEGFPNGAPIVRVSASVDYIPLFGTIGLPGLTLNAASEAAVIGA